MTLGRPAPHRPQTSASKDTNSTRVTRGEQPLLGSGRVPGHDSRVICSVGRDELNLIDFPIGTLSNKQPVDSSGHRLSELVFTVNNFDEQLGRVVPKRLTTRTSSRHGFPTPKEEQLLIGLMLLTRVKNNFTEPRVEFRPGELYALMNWPNDSTSKRQLHVGLDRLSGVKLKYENSWSTRSGQTYEKEFTTGILDSYQLTTLKSGQARRSVEPCWVQWSAEVFADMRSGNVKELNTNQFFALKYPLTRRMYRFLDKHLLEKPILEMDLRDFAAHIGIAETEHVGKIKARLRDALIELESIPDFIKACAASERYRKLRRGHWLVTFERGGTAIPAKQSPAASQQAVASDDRSHPDDLVKEFHRLWSNNKTHRPVTRELELAQSVIAEYGHQACVKLLPAVVKLMRSGFADARWFGATQAFWPQAARRIERHNAAEAQTRTLRKSEQQEQHLAEERRERKEKLRTIWKRLSATEQDTIRRKAYGSADATVRRMIKERQYDDTLVELACHRVLEACLADGSIAA